jgi:hypothetical protein
VTASVALLALAGCGRGDAGTRAEASVSASVSASASPPVASTSAPAPGSAAPPASARPSAVPADAVAKPSAPPSFAGAKSEKACHAQTVELGSYQQRGEIALAGQKDAVAATWRVQLPRKAEEQVAFGSFDKEGRPVAKVRGVGVTAFDVPPRVFPAGAEWTVVWFDDKGLAYVRPKIGMTPPPAIGHLGAVASASAGDVALGESPSGAVLAATPFGAGKAQLGLFLLASPEEGAQAVRAFGVTHHAKAPRRAAVAADAAGTFVAWYEGTAILASHFDPAGKEADAACTVAPESAEPRERFALTPTATGALALWMEGGKVRTRALDRSGCPASPIWTVTEGRWASLAAMGDTAVVAWASADGKLLSVRLGADGAPGARGLEASEGSSGIKDAPAVAAFGGKVAFGWAEVVSPVISTKRLVMRIVDGSCVP